MTKKWLTTYGTICLVSLIMGTVMGFKVTENIYEPEIQALRQQVYELENQVMAWEEWYKDWEELQRTLAESNQPKMESWDEINGLESELRKIRKELEFANFQRRLENIWNIGK